MDDFLAFISARLDEEEAMAKATSPSGTRLSWRAETDACEGEADTCWVLAEDGAPAVVEALGLERGTGRAVAEHVAHNDPERTLRTVAGERRLVGKAAGQPGYHLPEGQVDERTREERYTDDALRLTMYELLRDRAARWSDHPDYDARMWSPEGRVK